MEELLAGRDPEQREALVSAAQPEETVTGAQVALRSADGTEVNGCTPLQTAVYLA